MPQNPTSPHIYIKIKIIGSININALTLRYCTFFYLICYLYQILLYLHLGLMLIGLGLFVDYLFFDFIRFVEILSIYNYMAY